MRVSAIVVAAGKGIRLKSNIPKALVKINSIPVIIYSLSALSKDPGVYEIIVVTNRAGNKAIVRAISKYRIPKIKAVVLGGARRQDSVYNGLKATSTKTCLVLIHDAARPFIDKSIVSTVIGEAKKIGAAVVGVPVKSTIKEIMWSQSHQVTRSPVVRKTIDRSRLWEIQTPQVFKKDLLLAAYKKFGNMEVTDDAMLVEKMGKKVTLVKGTYNNIKITTPEDIILAQAIAKIWKPE